MTFDSKKRDGFRALESLSEDRIAPGANFLFHARENIDFVRYVQEGALVHQDPDGRSGRLGTGEFQRASSHDEIPRRALNESSVNRALVFQSGIAADPQGIRPDAEQKLFPAAERKGIFRLVASPDGREASLTLHRDVRIYSSLVHQGNHLIHELAPGRAAWLHIVKGRVLMMSHCLRAGDGAAFVDETVVSLTAQEASEILLFDLP